MACERLLACHRPRSGGNMWFFCLTVSISQFAIFPHSVCLASRCRECCCCQCPSESYVTSRVCRRATPISVAQCRHPVLQAAQLQCPCCGCVAPLPRPRRPHPWRRSDDTLASQCYRCRCIALAPAPFPPFYPDPLPRDVAGKVVSSIVRRPHSLLRTFHLCAQLLSLTLLLIARL